jgi:ArsR family transcriptional regulator
MLLDKKELCVCQLMGVLGMAQSLVSRNLSLLYKAGFLNDRKDGKMVFYKLKKGLPKPLSCLMKVLRTCLKDNETVTRDLKSLKDCTEYQKKTGRCDMETLVLYMKRKKKATNK